MATDNEKKAGENEIGGSRAAQKALGRTERKAKKPPRPVKRKNGR